MYGDKVDVVTVLPFHGVLTHDDVEHLPGGEHGRADVLGDGVDEGEQVGVEPAGVRPSGDAQHALDVECPGVGVPEHCFRVPRFAQRGGGGAQELRSGTVDIWLHKFLCGHWVSGMIRR